QIVRNQRSIPVASSLSRGSKEVTTESARRFCSNKMPFERARSASVGAHVSCRSRRRVVDRVHAIEFLTADIRRLERRRLYAGIVEGSIKPSEGRDRLLDDPRDIGLVGDVATQGY